MELFGWIAFTIGAVMFVAALLRMVRANPDTRIPYFRNAEISPRGTIMARSISVGLLVIGAAALASTLGYWMALLVLVLPLIVTPAMIATHNRGLASAA